MWLVLLGRTGSANAYPIQAPPLTSIEAPVMKSLSEDARKTATRATSSGVSSLPRGVSST